ncbi:MAG: hypothetical protein WC180_02615 [Candidatus Paceibacterota bacterium]|jgi:hypothetical protein
MEMQTLSDAELECLKNYERQAREMEDLQIIDLDRNCNVSFQYAKTYSVYVRDWEKTKDRMVEQLETGALPPDTGAEFYKKMIEIGDKIIEDKLKKVQVNFENKFGESIFNYLGEDGKAKGSPILLILMIIVVILLLLL